MNLELASAVKPGNRIIGLIGPGKQGKTTAAASISEYFPDNPPATEHTVLRDTVFIQTDSDGISTLKKLKVEPYLKDLSGLTTLKDFFLGFNAAVKDIKEAVAAGQIKFVVFDTLTALDKIIAGELQKTIQDNRVWNAILGKHMDVAFALKSLPCTVIVNAHTKFMGAFAGSETPEMQARKRATSMPGRAEIGLACTPSAADYWKTQMSAILPVYAIPEGKSDFRHVILTKPSRGFECGHRYGNLDEEEPAHLRKLLQKAGAY